MLEGGFSVETDFELIQEPVEEADLAVEHLADVRGDGGEGGTGLGVEAVLAGVVVAGLAAGLAIGELDMGSFLDFSRNGI